MKIAHINNTSGIASTLSRRQRSLGNVVEVYVFNKYLYQQFGGTKINYRFPFSRWNFFKKLNDFEVWHYHYPYGSLRRTLEKRRGGKIYLKHYHGDDLRGKFDNDFCLVSTPDLLEYAPNGKWFPTPIDLDKLVYLPISSNYFNHTKKPIVAHYPHYRLYKKYEDLYSTALNQLKKEGKCEVITIFDIPHDDTLKILSSCDLVVGKILPQIGWFGKLELEAMALGKPVVTYVSSFLFQSYNPPIYRTTKDSLKSDLETLLSDTEEQRKLSKAGRLYVEKFHSVGKSVKFLDSVYRTNQ